MAQPNSPAEMYEQANRLVAQSMRFRKVPCCGLLANRCKQRALELRAAASVEILRRGGDGGLGGYHPTAQEKSPPAHG